MSNKKKIIKLDEFNVNAIAEIQGKRELLENIVKENPFVEVIDNTTYEVGKKSRTALRTARTSTRAEEKVLVDAIKKNITDKIKVIYAEFVDITGPAEDLQQETITSYENTKALEKAERDRIEEERKQKHITAIDFYFNQITSFILLLDYESSKSYEINPMYGGKPVAENQFEEFQDMFCSKIEILKMQLSDKKKILTEKEEIRIALQIIEDAKLEAVRIDTIKGTIERFFNHWNGKINSVSFDDYNSLRKEFNEADGFDCQELQPKFAEKRAELVKLIEARKLQLETIETQRLAQVKFEEEKAIFKAEQKAILDANEKTRLASEAKHKKTLEDNQNTIDNAIVIARSEELVVLGFYNIFTVNGTLSNARVRELLLDYNDNNWIAYINEIVRLASLAEKTNEVEVGENTCNELLAGVDFEEATQKTKEDLIAEIDDFITVAKYDDLVKVVDLIKTL
jgi:hypothetical protein